MSKKTSMNRLRRAKSNSNLTYFWMNRMDAILDTERTNGLTGLHLSADPTASTCNVARDFCLMYHAVKTGQCKEVYGVIL